MAERRDPTLAEQINTWVQICAILIAGIWAAYTFYFKEIHEPRHAPINISMTVQLKKVGAAFGKDGLIPVEVRISATNPSSREIYLLPNIWIIAGYKVSRSDKAGRDFEKRASAVVNAQDADHEEKAIGRSTPTILAAGSIFEDKWINPSETLARTVLIHVPEHKYNVLAAASVMPSTTVQGKFALKWTIDKETYQPTVYRVQPDGTWTPMTQKENRCQAKRKELQQSVSDSTLSLWE